MNWLNPEFIGLAGTIMILIAFLFNDEKQIRVFDAIGAALFVIYGVIIGSLSNVVLNAILIGIQMFKLKKIRKSEAAKEGGRKAWQMKRTSGG